MGTRAVTLEQRQAALRERHAHVAVPDGQAGPFAERHYSVADVSMLWSLSPDAVRRLFADEPGVLVLGDRSAAHKRRYTTLRIPESVLQRVHRRRSNV